MSDEYKVIAGGEILKINGEFYLGKRIDNRIEELVCISEAIKDKLEVGKIVLIGIKEITRKSNIEKRWNIWKEKEKMNMMVQW